MQQVNLNFLEKRELLEKYRSDLRKVDFERNYLTQLIHQLENELQIPATAAPQRNVQYTAPRAAAAAAAAAVAAAPKQKRTYSKSDSEDIATKQQTYGIKLSSWDVLMLDTLENITEPLNSGALLEIFEAKNESLAKPLDDKQLRNALSRTVHKLANKKDVILKENFEGKGFLYTLNPNYKA